MPSPGPCFFCEGLPHAGYESNDRFLWLCKDHWRIIANTMVDELEESGIIRYVVYDDED
jgi:hypothetical protein